METKEPRTAAATRAVIRAAEERAATRLRDRGWICVAPDAAIYDALRRDWFGIPNEEA